MKSFWKELSAEAKPVCSHCVALMQGLVLWDQPLGVGLLLWLLCLHWPMMHVQPEKNELFNRWAHALYA